MCIHTHKHEYKLHYWTIRKYIFRWVEQKMYFLIAPQCNETSDVCVWCINGCLVTQTSCVNTIKCLWFRLHLFSTWVWSPAQLRWRRTRCWCPSAAGSPGRWGARPGGPSERPGLAPCSCRPDTDGGPRCHVKGDAHTAPGRHHCRETQGNIWGQKCTSVLVFSFNYLESGSRYEPPRIIKKYIKKIL